MKQRHKRLLILIVISLNVVNIFAYDFIKGGIKYNILTSLTCEVADGRNEILQNDYKGRTFVIPPQVEYKEKVFTVTAIENFAFQNAEISEIIIPETITKIGFGAFDRSDLQHIKLPSSLSEIPGDAFSQCYGLYDVEIPNGVTYIGGSSFFMSGLYAIDIPNTVTTISSNAFKDCKCLETVSIGNGIKYIDRRAFLGCHNITRITIHNPKPPIIRCAIDEDVFQGITYLSATLYVPKGALEAYGKAEYWSKFENIKELENSGIENLNACSIHITTNGSIVVNGLDEKVKIEIYRASGQLVYSGTDTTISMPTNGIYIVKIAGQTFKVVL